MIDLDYAVETVLRRERDAYREALERVTKERDEARQLAAHLSATLAECDGSAAEKVVLWRDRALKAETERDEARDFTAYLGRIGGWVSPEAFDAALREVAEAASDVTEPLDAIIAAAKAKHGGGK